VLQPSHIAKALERGYLEQRGVLRTNCIDCLDRTNVGQFAVGMRFLGASLKVMSCTLLCCAVHLTALTSHPSLLSFSFILLPLLLSVVLPTLASVFSLSLICRIDLHQTTITRHLLHLSLSLSLSLSPPLQAVGLSDQQAVEPTSRLLLALMDMYRCELPLPCSALPLKLAIGTLFDRSFMLDSFLIDPTFDLT
jgi:hypothetical protein